MGEANRRGIVGEAANAFAKAASDDGKLIEAGWLALKAMWLDPESPPEQVNELRQAFFAGAQHLFGSIMGILDPGEEPTDADLKRMDLISAELDAFIKDFELRHVPTQGSA
jgi:hypothetical protein